MMWFFVIAYDLISYYRIALYRTQNFYGNKNNFVGIPKNLAKSENNFVRLSKQLHIYIGPEVML